MYQTHALKDEIRKGKKIKDLRRYTPESFLTTLLGRKVTPTFKVPGVTKTTSKFSLDIYIYIGEKDILNVTSGHTILVEMNWLSDLAREWIYKKKVAWFNRYQ